MTIAEAATPAPAPIAGRRSDGRGSFLPTPSLIGTRLLELRRRRGLMVAVMFFTFGLPFLVLGVRLIFHAVDPSSYGPAGTPTVFIVLGGTMAEFGFIIAATLGAAAGTTDLSEGMFRHLVITGRSRLALYLARIPSGLAILLPMVAIGFAGLCLVCSFAGTAQPSTFNVNGVSVPIGLSETQLKTWIIDHPQKAELVFAGSGSITTNNGPGGSQSTTAPGSGIASVPPAEIRNIVDHKMGLLYSRYSFLAPALEVPPINEMVKIGLWLELVVGVGCVVGIGVGSLVGQRTVATVMLIGLQIIVTPILANVTIPYFLNGQRLIVGVALDQLRPAGLLQTARPEPGHRVFGGGTLGIPPMPTWAMVAVIAGWIVGWSAIGAWRMITRDA